LKVIAHLKDIAITYRDLLPLDMSVFHKGKNNNTSREALAARTSPATLSQKTPQFLHEELRELAAKLETRSKDCKGRLDVPISKRESWGDELAYFMIMLDHWEREVDTRLIELRGGLHIPYHKTHSTHPSLNDWAHLDTLR